MPTFASDALAGKVAVVTGAARGIGRCAAIALAQAGADVVGIDLCAAPARSTPFRPRREATSTTPGRW
ncbi:SDR family NAD(P)-dependent oxidoreductase (plasmid) [Sphingomonas naphthae]|uniref:SDR family NAD(P)-dependent oxidoreductase n=1 Tax=Sphingomonas naphthae TaxID=1813468 RepID=A0ABY7TR25_9SPHN|nr:SDR family NAD(P)-dependent oxidoreductase [Sphingomonas naphthae]WCT75677.1 SDR family NAD(P)-dependent oxidoreductase [Sphingomonas naphthae]